MLIKERFVLALMVLSAAYIPGLGQTAGDWIDQGNHLYDQGNYSEAIKAYDRALDEQKGGNATSSYLMLVDRFFRGSASHKSYTITVSEFLNQSKNDTGWIIVDVREPQEYLHAHIKGAMNFPYRDLAASMKTIPAGKNLAVYCASNKRAQYAVMALRIFEDREAWILLDGVSAWKAAGQPIDSGPALKL